MTRVSREKLDQGIASELSQLKSFHVCISYTYRKQNFRGVKGIKGEAGLGFWIPEPKGVVQKGTSGDLGVKGFKGQSGDAGLHGSPGRDGRYGSKGKSICSI